MAMLKTIGLTKYFGGLAAVNNVDLEVKKGEILGLIGPNGSGKTTLFNVISGWFKPTSGKVIFKGEDITGLRPHVVTKKGLVKTFQHETLFEPQTTVQNALLGSFVKSGIGFWGEFFNTESNRRKEEATRSKSLELLKFVGLDTQKDILAGNLSHGYRKTLNLAIALGAEPELLLLDEPLTGLNPERVALIQKLICEIRDSGRTIVVIEHNMKALFPLCNRVVVLDAGMKVAEGKTQEIREDQNVIRIYLGGARRARQ